MKRAINKYLCRKNYIRAMEAHILDLPPTGSEQRGVLGLGSIPVVILPSCQYMKSITKQGK